VKRLLTILAAVVLLPAASARANVTAGTQTTSSGAVSATLAWQAGEGPQKTTLTITRAGASAFSALIPNVCDDFCLRFLDEADDFQTTDLDGDGEPEVLVIGNNEDGDDCCEDNIGIYRWDAAAGTYREYVRHFPSIEMSHHRGKTLIVAQDTRLDGVQPFNGILPRRVFEYAPGPTLVDVSKTDGLAQIHDDLGYRAYAVRSLDKDETSFNRGEVLSYVAEEYLVGHGALARRQMDHLIKVGKLGSPESAAAFRTRLLKALRRYGYSS
jgi:hypothetical protein